MGDSVTGQWALNDTAVTLTGVVHAATSDNIPPDTLIVAQIFGSQLAISETTKLKIEDIPKLYRRFGTIEFLKCKIGYARGDSADQLASSDGGVRFLGLTAALLCTTTDSFFAARVLHGLILETVSSRPQGDPRLPTVKTLQQLLDALEYKLRHAGFADNVSGWGVHLPEYGVRKGGDHPSQGMIKALVKSFSQIGRLGRDGVVEIHAYTGITWIIAFAKWCFDAAPGVVAGDGRVLIPQAHSGVLLHINRSASEKEEVKLIYKIDSPDVLWSGPSEETKPWSGMVSIGTYGSQQLLSRQLTSPKARNALREAFCSSIPLVSRRLWPGNNTEDGTPFHPALGYDSDRGERSKTGLHQFRSHMFGPKSILIATEYLGLDTIDQNEKFSQDGLHSFDALEIYLQDLVTGCGCSTCSHDPQHYEEDGPFGLKVHRPGSLTDLATLAASICGKATQNRDIHSHCAVMRFWAMLSIMTAEILTLSLFELGDAIQVFWPGETAALVRADGKFTDSVYKCLFWRRRLFWKDPSDYFCRVQDVLQLATSMIGHKVSRELDSSTWIASAFRGQVIFPLLFSLGQLTTRPLLLGGGAARLFFEGSSFDKIVSKSLQNRHTNVAISSQLPIVDHTKSPFTNDTINWQISLASDDPELFFSTPRAGPTMYNPHVVLSTIARSLFVRCTHPQDTPLNSSAGDYAFTAAPFYNNGDKQKYFDHASEMENYIRSRDGWSGKDAFKIQVLPTAGNEGLRLFAMLSSVPGVVNQGACLPCCVEVCRISGLEYIVL